MFNYLKDHGLVYLNGQDPESERADEDCVVCDGGGGGRGRAIWCVLICCVLI